MDKKLPSFYKTAIVAESDASFGVARMYQIMRMDAPEQAMVFRVFKDAAEWLNLPEDVIDLAESDLDQIKANM